MKVHLYGTRGSTPGQPRGSHKFGGHTTCLRVLSDCIPADFALVVDAGSGLVQLSQDLFKEGKKNVAFLFTHWHHDHTQGMFLSGHTFAGKQILMWGPEEHNIGPQKVFKHLMKAPFFPVEFAKIAHRFRFRALENIGTQVLAIHPEGGFNLFGIDAYRKIEKEGLQIPFARGRYDLKECMIVFMFKTDHPEYTVSYRFEEKPTGRVFVFLTDQEREYGMPQDMKNHLKGAHFLIQDSQYSEETYRTRTAGFGHGTPEYCVDCAYVAEADQLGLTHHDPGATDEDIEQRLKEAQTHLEKQMLAWGSPSINIFACADDTIHNV